MMRFFSSRVANVAVFLLIAAAVFAQHSTQTNPDANVSGAAESTGLATLDFGRFSHGLLVSNFSAGRTTQAAGPDAAAELYFTAGRNQEAAGLFGYLTPVNNELVQGNSQ